MKKPPIFNPAPLSADNPAMRNAIEALIEAGITFSRPGPYHLKVGPLNFFPDTGRIHKDGEKKSWEAHGLDAFIKYLRTLMIDDLNCLNLRGLMIE